MAVNLPRIYIRDNEERHNLFSGKSDQHKNTVLGHSHLLQQISLCISNSVTSMVTARVTGLCRSEHRTRSSLKFPYVGPLLALNLINRGYRSNMNKTTRQNLQEKRS